MGDKISLSIDLRNGNPKDKEQSSLHSGLGKVTGERKGGVKRKRGEERIWRDQKK